MPFQKGAGVDKNINRHGRPKSFDALRNLCLQLANEEVDGKPQVEVILRSLIKEDPKTFLQYCYGKVPDEVLSDSVHRILVTYEGDPNGKQREPSDLTNTAFEAVALLEESSQEADSESGTQEREDRSICNPEP